MSCAPACFPATPTRCSTVGALCGSLASSQDGQGQTKVIDDIEDFKGFAKPTLSARGAQHAASVTPFWTVFDSMLRDVYCPEKNQNGIINMGIANNSLMQDELLEYFSKHLVLDPTDLTYGTSLHGSIRLFDALCAHFNRQAFGPVLPVRSDHLLTGPGCGPLLDQLFEHLAAPGESCLAAAPYYNGFDADLMTRAQVKCVPVFATEGDGTAKENFTGPGALRGFEDALEAQNAAGSTVRAVLICNPHNPIGKCYDREALLEYGRFAQTHDLHLVFDEIYAMSTFPTSDDPSPQPFISALNIDWAREAGCDPRRVHILTSASKDFGLNGFRVGTFISQYNSELMAAMKVTTKLYMVASPADALFSHLLLDDDFYPHFVQTNQARLSKAFEVLKRWCLHHAIPYKPSNAGHFLLVDLARFLPCQMGGHDLVDETERETALWSQVLKERLCITPGSNYHHPQVGWFRITFSLQDDVLLKGLQRLEKALGLVPSATSSLLCHSDSAKEKNAMAVVSPVLKGEEGEQEKEQSLQENFPVGTSASTKKKMSVDKLPSLKIRSSLTTMNTTSRPNSAGIISALSGGCSSPAPVPVHDNLNHTNEMDDEEQQDSTTSPPPLASQVASRVMEDYGLLKQLSLDSERGRALGCMC